MLEKILKEIEKQKRCCLMIGYAKEYNQGALKMAEVIENIIRKHMNDGWISCEERMPEDRRANYEVTFINECGYEEHGFAQWYDGDFHIPAVVIAWREHLEPYRPEKGSVQNETE